MKINQLACLLVPVLALSLPISADNWEKTDDDGSSFIFGRGETTTSPGGFSAVAEPAGPVDPEAAKRAAEKYRFHCVTVPKIIAIFDKTEVITPEKCTAQVNGTVTTT